MSTLSGKLEFLQEIKSPGNGILELFGCKKYNLPKICPDQIPVIELLEGNWGDVGCTILVHYSFGGKEVISMEIVVAVDKENQSMTYDFSEGELIKMYKTMKCTFQIISKDGKNFLKWTWVYEKMNADVPAPDTLKGLASEIGSITDAHCVELNNKTHGSQA